MNGDQLRVGDAERDEVTSALHEHFAQGRLTRDELDERLAATLSARTVGDLRAVTRDLPAEGGVAVPHAGPHAGPLPRGRGPWEMGAPYWRGPRSGRGPFMSPYGGWHRPPFRPLVPLFAMVILFMAFTGWWMAFPLLAVAWCAIAFTRIRHVRRHHPLWRRF